MEDDSPQTKTDMTAGSELVSEPMVRRKLGKVDPSFFIIGVGASAGGLEAIKQLIGQAPEGFPHSFVAIQHISPDYKSLMPEILARETKLPVREVLDDMAVEPGHIYLIPPKSNVIIQGTGDEEEKEDQEASEFSEGVGLRFSLVPPMPRPQLNLPIDLFFHSLAEAVGDRAIGIILSGTGTDGSRGLRGIKDRDGFVLVQEPETANFDGMPNSAIATNLVDIVTTPDAMISEVMRYIGMREEGVINVDALFRNAEAEFKELLALISDISDIDFSQYKEPTLKRRIARRVGLNHFSSVREYTAFARERPHELAILHREFLVGVTNFFRDLPSWNVLREKVIPALFAHGNEGDVIKVWSVGCSTGEEPYTIAMLMEQYRRENDLTREFRVFATDVNADAIRSAKEGIYPESVIEEIPPEFHGSEYVSFHSGTFHISKALRARVIFSEHNALEDPPYINTDLVICRNVLIYLSSDMQKKVLSLFSFSTRKDGYMFLGAAEHVARQSASFEVENSSARIYRNARKSKRAPGTNTMDRAHAMSVTMPRGRRLATRESQRSTSAYGGLLGNMLGQLHGCIFLVDDSGQILETFGDYRKFLVLPERAFSSNIYDLVHDRLKSAVSLQIRRAEAEGSAEITGVKCSVGDEVQLIDIFCSRVEWEGTLSTYSVMLRNTGPLPEAGKGQQDGRRDGLAADRDIVITRLEGEIESLQEMLSVTAEDLGVANEELQTTNEELTVSNEELQANNEEMQSINEELHTVNAENAEKIAQLVVANADIENLLDTADLGVVFLDEDLAIRRFNSTFTRYVDLTGGDIGRKLTSFAAEIERDDYAVLLDDIERVRDHGKEAIRDVLCRDGATAQARARPFRTTDGHADGVVLSLIDTTRMQQLTTEVQMQRDRLAGLLEGDQSGYWDWDIPAEREYLSPQFKAMFGYREDELKNHPETRLSLIHPDDLAMEKAAFEAHVASQGKTPYEHELRYFHKDGSIVWVMCRGRVSEWDRDGKPLRMLGVNLDITRLKHRELAVHAEAEDARRFAFAAAHDLLQPVNTIERGLSSLIEDLSEKIEPEQKQVLTFIDQATARMRTRIHGVLDFAQVFDDEPPQDKVDLNPVAQASIDDLRAQIDEIGAEVVLKDLPEVITIESLVPRLFQNLLSNALKYRKARGKCRIVIEPAPAEQGWVAIRVIDNGIGIPAEHRPKLFKMFTRLHTEAEYEGIGVGLALCERIMALSGGRIVIDDGVDGGTAFICTFKAPPG